MSTENPDFRFHIQLALPSMQDVQKLVHRPNLRLVRYQQLPDETVLADFLATGDETDAMAERKYGMKVLARINTAEDLKREVSQINRYEAAPATLKKKRKP